MDGSQLCRRAQLSSIDIDQTEAAAVREHLLVPFGERNVSSPVRNHQDLQQGQTRRDRRQTSFVDRCEDRIEHRQKARMLLNEIDEGHGVERERAIADRLDHSHDLRSTST